MLIITIKSRTFFFYFDTFMKFLYNADKSSQIIATHLPGILCLKVHFTHLILRCLKSDETQN